MPKAKKEGAKAKKKKMKRYLIRTDKCEGDANKFISKEGNLFLYYREAFKRVTDRNYQNKIVNYIFEHALDQPIENIKPFDRQKIIDQFSKQSYEEFREKIDNFCDILVNIPLTNYFFTISKFRATMNPNIVPFEISNFENRERVLGKKIKSIDKILVSLKYNNIHTFLVRGNQYSTFTEDLFTSGLYDIEVFGSAFNTRLPRYGHIYTGSSDFERNLEKPFDFFFRKAKKRDQII